MRFNQTNVRAGMTARGTKGEKLGKVVRADGDTFIVEKGTFFHKDYELYYEYVTDVRADEIVYALEDARLADRDVQTRASQALADQRNLEEWPVRRVSHEERRNASDSLRHEEVEVEDTTATGRPSPREHQATLSAAGHEGDGLKKT